MTKDSRAPSRSRIFALLQLLALLMPLLLSPLAAAQSTPPDVRFGVVEAFRASKDAAALGLGWERAIFFWNQIQPNGPNEWNDFYFEDSWLADATANSRQIVGLLEGTPLWATDGTSSAAVPRGLSLPIDDPNNLWATFVRTIVRRYAGRIDHWIIWNEPDIAPGEYGVQWDGSVADFVRLTKVAYLVAKQENPNAVIHFAGLTYWHDVVNGRRLYLQRYLDEARKDPLAAENTYFFDAISLHIYFTSDTVYDITSTFAEVLRRNGLSQAIWINETNAPPFNDWLNPWTIPDWEVTLDQQAGFIVQAFAQGLAAGAQRIAVYKMVDFPPYPPGYEPYGLVRSDGSRRPAFAAMRTVIKHFAGTRSASMDRTTTRTLVTLDRGNKTTRVLWARGKASVPVTLPAFAPQAILVRHLGGTRIITPINGVYSLTLPGALCADPLHGCAVGGAPLLLVEEASPDATAESQPTGDAVTVTATPSPTPTATRSPSPTPTLTPTVTASATPTATRTLAPSPTATQTPVPSPQIAPNPSSISGLVALALAGAVMLATWVLNRREQGSRRDHPG